MKNKIIQALAGLSLALGIGAATASAADASTPGCISGTYASYCGTQTNPGTLPLSIDVKQQAARYNQPVIGYGDALGDPATDFFMFAYNGGDAKVFEYAPNGVASNFCLSDPGNSLVVERLCNGSKWQRWTASGQLTDASGNTGYTWTNMATDKILSTNGYKGQVITIAAPVAVPPAKSPVYTDAELFNFAS